MHSKHYTLILVRNEGSRFRKWRVSQVQVVALSAVVGLLTLAAAYSSWSAFSSRVNRGELARLQDENETLRLTNQSFENRLDGLQTRLSDSEDRTRKLAIVAGLENLGASSEAGVGGPLPSAADSGSESGAAAQLAAVEGRSEFLNQTLEQVESRLSDNLRLISSTPSIAPVRGIYTSAFGFRRDPITGQRAYHSGVDISAPPGKPVKASADGVVTKTEQYGGLGRAVFVAHGFGVTTIYGHLSRINVTPGQRVERGAIVGLVGNSGRSTGYHLHYEVQVNGQATNPLAYILDRADGAL
ncbi:MAG: M23 family metallopeptidase [Thermoanaerobaculia bacterium]